MSVMIFGCSFSLFYDATQCLSISRILLARLLRHRDSAFRGWNYSRPPGPPGIYMDSGGLNSCHCPYIAVTLTSELYVPDPK